MKIPAFELQEGDTVDLAGHSPYVKETHRVLEMLFTVDKVTDEGACIAVSFIDFDTVGFPRNRLITVQESRK